MRKYTVDRDKISDGELSKDLMNFFVVNNSVYKEFAFDILMVLAFGVTREQEDCTTLILKRGGLSYTLPIK